MSASRKGLTVWVDGIGLLGPGLSSWSVGREVLRGERAREASSTALPMPARLPPAERRRAGAAVKLALAVADEAVAQAQVDPAGLATVFTSSSGEGVNCHALCETLATPTPLVSPIRFTNSVHNAASGCWHIAVGSRAASTSLCAFDGSFGAGLLEAATSVVTGGAPILLVASDSPYPEPLHSKRPLPDHFGLALLLAPVRGPRSVAALSIEAGAPGAAASHCADPRLESLRLAIPAAEALPLLVALARSPAAGRVVLDYLPPMQLRLETLMTRILERDGIAALIPHAGRMCLLDRLIAWDRDAIVCEAGNHRAPDHPLRTRRGLLVPCAIEYAAQAMALHGALIGRDAGTPATPGFLASVRGVSFHVLRLDDLPLPADIETDTLRVEATRQAGDERQILYTFRVQHAARPVADGRAAGGTEHATRRMNDSPDPKRALVTGASGGLGRAIASRLARDGLHVVVHANSRLEVATALAAEIVAAGGRAEPIAFDVTDREACAAACTGILAHGPIQVLVNNAGTHADAAFPALSAAQWHDVMAVSVTGFFNVTQALAMPMIRTRWGRVINISSVTSLTGNRGQVNYAAAKGALNSATKSLSLELASRGITVNAVAPGVIESGMAEGGFDKATIDRLVPARRAGRPEEVAALVSFLASEDAGYISGQVISVNGGMI